MKVALKLGLLAIAVALVAVAACSDDTKPAPDKGTTPVEASVVDKSLVDKPQTKTEASVGDKGPAKEAAATGACLSANDKAAVDGTKTWNGKTIKEIVSGQAACLANPKPEDCIVAAVKTAVNSEVSDGCITCYAKSAMCTVTNCLAAGCVTAPTSAACIKCQCGDNTAKVNCIKQFGDCSGVPPTTTCN